MYPAVIHAKAKENYCLEVRFSNGESGVLDMRPYMDFGIFKKIADPSKFCKIHVAFDTIEWDEGIDLDPEFIYQNSKILTEKVS